MTSEDNYIHVLLVDDDEDDYLITRNLITKIPERPFKLHWCPTYNEAKELIQADTFDLYMVDYRLGKETGLKLLEFAQPYERNKPFILLTDAGDGQVEKRAMELGASDYLMKGTFDAELLYRTLRYALQRKQAEEQRVQHLIELNQTKDEFISLASHQLRTPATGVKQYLGMVLEGFAGDVPERQRNMLEKAYESNDRQLQIVSDLLKVAQVDAGSVKLHYNETNLVDMMEDIIREQEANFKSRQQTVLFNKKPRQANVLLDPYNMRMVFENLLDNAGKYSPANTTIEVVIEVFKDFCCVHIHDEGVGIEEQDIGKLFQKFNRLTNPLSRQVDGTGLGLYWAKRIVDLHSGEIIVLSPGKNRTNGTTFTIHLPMNRQSEELKP